MDRASIIGIALGIGAVIGGNFAEGGRVESILQPTAAIIVFGGTCGAVLLSYPLRDVIRAAASLKAVFFEREKTIDGLIKDIVRFASLARKGGFIALDTELPKINDPFLKKALRLVVDGMGPKALRETLEQEAVTMEDEERRIAKVFDTAGGFAPTIGIIGAVLGLIHVMENLSDPARLGSGIAVAFVATVYGVGSANLIFLPISKKLQHRAQRDSAVRQMIIEGVMGIQSGINPYYLEERIKACIPKDAKAR